LADDRAEDLGSVNSACGFISSTDGAREFELEPREEVVALHDNGFPAQLDPIV
jgi:hypothetical protein